MSGYISFMGNNNMLIVLINSGSYGFLVWLFFFCREYSLLFCVLFFRIFRFGLFLSYFFKVFFVWFKEEIVIFFCMCVYVCIWWESL